MKWVTLTVFLLCFLISYGWLQTYLDYLDYKVYYKAAMGNTEAIYRIFGRPANIAYICKERRYYENNH